MHTLEGTLDHCQHSRQNSADNPEGRRRLHRPAGAAKAVGASVQPGSCGERSFSFEPGEIESFDSCCSGDKFAYFPGAFEVEGRFSSHNCFLINAKDHEEWTSSPPTGFVFESTEPLVSVLMRLQAKLQAATSSRRTGNIVIMSYHI